MNKDILLKYLNNGCSDEEFEELVRWIKTSSGNKEDKSWSFDQWKIFVPEQREDKKQKYNALLDKIHHEINLKHLSNKNNEVIFSSVFFKWLSRAAAVLIMPLIGVLIYLLSNNNFLSQKIADNAADSLEVIAPIGSRTVLQLSDGTEVHLNYGSKIKYPREFLGQTREITLSGEAYFDVAHNPDKPFIVKTGKLNVKAVGTEFNVQAYPEYEEISTTLVEGKVVIEKILPDFSIQVVGTMVPDQHVVYNQSTDDFSSSKENTEKYTAWKEGKMIFDNTPITQVTHELSRKFNVDIEIADDINYLTYTVTFVDDPLFLILDLMSEITPINYTRIPRKKLANGTFSKQKIKIEKRK